MFINNAYAQAAVNASEGGSYLYQILPFIAIAFIMYFMIFRPQRNQMKQRQEMLNAVRRGDSVVTGGGVIGRVTKVLGESGELEVEIAEGVRIRVLRSTLANVRVRGEPIADNAIKTEQKPKINKKENKKNPEETSEKKDEDRAS
ncbi:preprotein translocase subunit YajC [Bartonella sp. DGB2]|uniref:preprotein translocase subunit YajC n=1 Tax=Bartonella sp. DGB2 TaxID=3388426 RepID=UPI00398FC6E2